MQKFLKTAPTQRVAARAGLWFGLIFGFGFAVFAWGWDAWLLSSSGATLAWVKFLFGLPIALILGGLTGYLSARSPYVGVTVAAWAIVGGLLGLLAGHLPFEGRNFSIWLTNPNLRGEVVFICDYSAKVRTILVIGITLLLGAFTGGLEGIAIQWAQDHEKPEGGLSSTSWLALLIGIPIAFLMSLAVNSLINQPLRRPEQVTGNLIKQANAGELAVDSIDYRTIQPFMDQLTADYRVHFVAFGGDRKSWSSAYVDAVFEHGFLLRCVTAENKVIFCDDFSEKYHTWMDDLARFGLSGEQPWMDEPIQYLAVDASVLDWLETQSPKMSTNYEIMASPPQNGWVFMSARYDSGFEMTCRFHGAAPILVDQCVEESPSPAE